MTVYTAWDGNEYPAPPPDGWYHATDGRWWPEGYGPGPAAVGAEPSPLGPSDRRDGPPRSEPTSSSIGAAATDDPMVVVDEMRRLEASGSGARRLLIVVALIGVVAAGVAGWPFLGSDDDEAATTTTASTVDTTVAGDDATTIEDEVTTTTEPPPEHGESLSDPFDLGEDATIRYLDAGEGEDRVWTVRVIEAAGDRTDDVLAENQFNTAPEGDDRFVMATLRITYESGPELGSLFDLNFSAIGPSGVVMTTFEPSCGVIPGGLDPLTELAVGATVEGTVCWVAEPRDLEGLIMILEAFLDDDRLFLALD